MLRVYIVDIRLSREEIILRSSDHNMPPKSGQKDRNEQNIIDDEDLHAQIDRPEDDEEDLLNMTIPQLPELISGTNTTANRLVITHIEVDNFKSYFGRTVIGPIHKVFCDNI